VFGGIVIGLQRFDISQGISILVILMRAIGTIAVLLKGYGIVGLAFVSLCSTLVGNVLQSFSAYKILETLNISIKFFNIDDCRRLFGFGMGMFVVHISGQIIYFTDTTVIGIFGSAAQITHFVIAGNLIDYSAALLSTISVVLFPRVTDQSAREDHRGIQRSLILGTRLTLSIGIPIYISFLVIGKEFIELWMGNKYGATSPIVLSILTIGTIVRVSQFNAVSILAGMHRHKFLASCMIVEAMANLLLSVLLMKFYGIYGVAIGTTVPIIFMRIFFVGRHVVKITGLDFMRYLRDTIFWSLGNGIFFLIPIVLLQQLQLYSWTKLAGSIMISLSIYLVALYYFRLNLEERGLIRQIF
jgi:O-antigen/teichoic acid export membrane protein